MRACLARLQPLWPLDSYRRGGKYGREGRPPGRPARPHAGYKREVLALGRRLNSLKMDVSLSSMLNALCCRDGPEIGKFWCKLRRMPNNSPSLALTTHVWLKSEI